MPRGKESGRSGSPTGCEPAFRDSYAYHLGPALFTVCAALDLVYSRLRYRGYCILYPDPETWTYEVCLSVSLKRPSFISGGGIPLHPDSHKTRRIRTIYIPPPRLSLCSL
jgi:hypothetical protein